MKLIVLDRDGVINEDSDEYIKSVDEWIPIPGSDCSLEPWRISRGRRHQSKWNIARHV